MSKKPAPIGGMAIGGYVLRAYAFAWIFWAPLLPPIKSAIGPLATPYLHLVGSLGPAVAAIAVTLHLNGRAGLADLWSRAGRWRVPVVWHFVAWFAPFGLYLAAILIATLGLGHFIGFSALSGQPDYPGLTPPLLWLVILIFCGFGQEIGWRGFLQPALEQYMAPLPAAALVSVVWAVWHLPLFWIAPGLTGLDASGVAGWFACILAASILLAWLTGNTRGSILIAAAFHATLDIAFLTAGPAAASPVIGVFVTVWGLVVAVVWLRQGNRRQPAPRRRKAGS